MSEDGPKGPVSSIVVQASHTLLFVFGVCQAIAYTPAVALGLVRLPIEWLRDDLQPLAAFLFRPA